MSAYAIVIFILVLIYSFYMGFNDGSQGIATTVVTRAVKLKTAIIVASIIKFVVPILLFLVGSISVASNIQESIIFNSYFENLTQVEAFAFILSGMLGAMIWGAIAFSLKIPNTISHTLLGGIIGAGIAAFGFSSIQWTDYVLLNVVAMVILAPAIGLLLGYLLMRVFRRIVRHANRNVSVLLNVFQRINFVMISAAFSSNNAQKALGVILLLSTLGLADFNATTMPIWIVILIALALTLGMLCGGYSVMNTVGRKIFKIQPQHSVVAQFTTAIVSVVGTSLGISLGMGQVMTSSVIGVGASERFKSVHWTTAGKIILGWCFTLPISASAGALVYMLVGKLILGL